MRHANLIVFRDVKSDVSFDKNHFCPNFGFVVFIICTLLMAD